jgi:hypothetical protein
MDPVWILMNVKLLQDHVDLELCVKTRLDPLVVCVLEAPLEIPTLASAQLTRPSAQGTETADLMRNVLNLANVFAPLPTFQIQLIVESVRAPVKDFSVVLMLNAPQPTHPSAYVRPDILETHLQVARM